MDYQFPNHPLPPHGSGHSHIPHYRPGMLPPPLHPIFHASLPQSEYDSVAVTYQQQLGNMTAMINELNHALQNYMRYFDYLVKFGIDNEFKWHWENETQPELDRIDKELADLRDYVDAQDAALKEYVNSENAKQDKVIQDNYDELNTRITNVRQELINLIDQLELKVDDNYNKLNTKIDSVDNRLDTKIDSVDNRLDTKIDSTAVAIRSEISQLNSTLRALIETTRSNLQSQIDVNKESADLTRDTLLAHMNNTNNPHEVTKTQVGLGEADNTSDMNKPISDAAAEKNAQQDTAHADLDDRFKHHIHDYENPHRVTLEQLGGYGPDNEPPYPVLSVNGMTGHVVVTGEGEIDLSNYYTKEETYSKEEVDEIVANIEAGEVDLSNYYTKPEIDEKFTTHYNDFEYTTLQEVVDEIYVDINDVDERVDATNVIVEGHTTQIANHDGRIEALEDRTVVTSVNGETGAVIIDLPVVPTNIVNTVNGESGNVIIDLPPVKCTNRLKFEVEANGGWSITMPSNERYKTWTYSGPIDINLLDQDTDIFVRITNTSRDAQSWWDGVRVVTTANSITFYGLSEPPSVGENYIDILIMTYDVEDII